MFYFFFESFAYLYSSSFRSTTRVVCENIALYFCNVNDPIGVVDYFKRLLLTFKVLVLFGLMTHVV